MGGVSRAIGKVLGADTNGPSAPTQIATQATEQATVEDSKSSKNKRKTRLGNKKLQIPTQQPGVATSGGTGLGIGV